MNSESFDGDVRVRLRVASSAVEQIRLKLGAVVAGSFVRKDFGLDGQRVARDAPSQTE